MLWFPFGHEQIAINPRATDTLADTRRNILFAIYNDFKSNSAGHVHALAHELIRLGYSCAVAVPRSKESVSNLGKVRFASLEFSELERLPGYFSDGRPPDIIHAWTPRESVRTFCEAVIARYRSHLFVHLEDNEWHLLERFTGRDLRSLSELSLKELDCVVPSDCTHPIRGLSFLKQARGITIIIDKLRELIPKTVPALELWPSAAEDAFFPSPRRPQDRRYFGIPENSTVLVYTGNVHAGNAREVRSLYLAVAILNREGHPATLVRTGTDFCSYLGPEESWARANSMEFGHVDRHQIPELLALSDVLVQPGRSDSFNDYRFPSKIPEFLSVGRPVILPRANIALHMRHGEHAWLLDNANGLAIAQAVRIIMAEPDLYARLADGALRFFRDHLSWSASAEKLSMFYAEQINKGRFCANAGT